MPSSFRRCTLPRFSSLISGICLIAAASVALANAAFAADPPGADAIRVEEDAETIRIETNALKATIQKKGYVSGIAGGTFVDKKTGQADLGFGLDIVDWVMAPGSDEAYRDKLPKRMVYEFGNPWHGDEAKRCMDGPQICTEAEELSPKVIRGDGFVAVEQEFAYKVAAPGRKPGSVWKQRIVFLPDARYVLSCDEVTLLEGGEELFLRTDLPGHIKHAKGDTFSEIYLSYLSDRFETPSGRFEASPGSEQVPHGSRKGRETPLSAPHPAATGSSLPGHIPSSEFAGEDFAPQAKFRYRRPADESQIPDRMIRAYRTRDAKSGEDGPWLAGMTLDPTDVYEGWCHQRGYICMIQEIGGRNYAAGDKIQAAYAIGWFDSIDEMNAVYDQHRGSRSLSVDGGKLTRTKE